MKDFGFVGVKVALFFEGQLLVYLRDDKPGLSFANMWDFPGGGREGEESPFECIAREVYEEFTVTLEPSDIIWQKTFPSMHDLDSQAYFMVGFLTQSHMDQIQFGSEGQKWSLMSVEEFLSRDDVVPHLKGRLQDYLDSA